MSRLVLASASPRRKELLEQIGLEFVIHVSNLPEETKCTQAEAVVQDLSKQKALHVWEELQKAGEDLTDTVVIGADTVVSVWGEVLGKPKDEEDAFQMLDTLQGRTHQVYTGVTLFWMQEEKRHHVTFYERTDVTMYPMSHKDIDAYIATGETLDKAGAYAIQGRCAAYVQAICGDYNNVVGLPVARVYQELKQRDLL